VQGKGGSTETLGVDPKSLSNLGNDMVSAADDIPPPPAPFTVSGTDPISTKIMGMQSSLETPIQTGLPEVKTAAKKTANSIVTGAHMYETTDEQLAKQIEQHTFDKPGTPSPSPGGGLNGAQGVVGVRGGPAEQAGFFTPKSVGGAVGGGAPGSALPAAPSAPTAPAAGPPSADAPASGSPGAGASGAGTSSGAAPAASTPAAAAPTAGTPASAAGSSAASGAGGAMGQMGQMISMPMQMAGQAMGMVTSVPQTIMQAAEGAVQQVTQLTEGLGQGGDHSAGDAQLAADHKGDESSTRPDEPARPEKAHEGAAPGQPHAERAPEGPRHAAEPAPPAAPAEPKPPAQTRPAESSETAL
jgi:hypothetical protein